MGEIDKVRALTASPNFLNWEFILNGHLLLHVSKTSMGTKKFKNLTAVLVKS